MIKRLNTYIVMLMAVLLVFSGMPGLNVAFAAPEDDGEYAYEIYPTPHELAYDGGEFVIRPEANIVYDSTIDKATKKRVKEIFDSKKVKLTESDKIVEGTTNILIGTKDSDEYVDTYFRENKEIDEALFSEIDPYTLSVDNGTIAILGKDTDAAFYGVTTLKHILNQMEGKTIRNLTINDYSTTTIRGFIEGYYGIPWSDEDRISLMEFGGDFKMTSYVFAPKDDEYHNSKWREPYPEERLAEIKEMVDAGRDSKVNFAWTIHPYMHNGINENNYDEGLEAITKKFEQLYDIGVRQFGVLADDAGNVNPETVVRLMNDLQDWADEKGDVYDFLTVPAGYNASWVGDWSNDGELSIHDEGFPESVQIMWTGDTVVGHITQKTLDTFKTEGKAEGEEPRRDPVIWLNWPVNDINMSRLMMGKGEMLHPGVTGLNGVVTNPMQDAEASKVSLFAIADYAWNLDDFDEDKSWADSFKYIDQDADEALHTLAKHMSDPAPNGHGLVLGESEEIKVLLAEFLDKYEAGESVKEIGNTLIEEFEEIAAATEDFFKLSKNEKLKEEIEPYAASLNDLVHANIAFIQTAIAVEDKDDDALWTNYVRGTSNFDASKQHDRPLLNNGIEKAIPGSKRLVPFAEQLKESLSEKVEQALGSDQLMMKPISNYKSGEIYEGSLDNLIDGDDASKVWFNRYIAEGDYVGVEYNQPIDITGLEVLQGNNAEDKDAFYYGKFQYFNLETGEWEDTTGKSYGEYLNTVEEKNLNIKTDKVRFIVDEDKGVKAEDEANPKWAAFREFKVLTENAAPSELDVSIIKSEEWTAYQGLGNVEDLLDDNLNTGVHYDTGEGDIAQEGSYFGLDLGEEIQLGKIRIDLGAPGNTNDKFTEFDLEYSVDGENYTKYDSYANIESLEEDLSDENIVARYVRLKNTKEIHKWVGFRTFKVSPPTANADGYTNVANLSLDANLGTDRFELEPTKDITLQPGEFVGLKLKRIHDLKGIDVKTSGEDLQLQIAKNEYEWKNVKDESDIESARFIRLINTSDNDITFDIEEFVATSIEIEAPHLDETNLSGMRGEGNEFDGDKTSSVVFEDHQAKGKYLIYDIGQEIDLESFEIFLHDSSLDFIYDGIVSYSTDKENWEKFMEIGDGEPNPNPNGNINDSYPNHKVSYNTIRAEGINDRARYIKIEITQDVNRWVQFNELEINDGTYFKVENDARFEASVIEERGGQAPNLVDGDLGTMYMPSKENGSVKYHISEKNDAQTITILQSENTKSNARVKARIAPADNPDKSEVITVGTLNQSLNKFQLPADYLIYDIEIVWEDVIPHLYELTLTNEAVEAVDKTVLEEAMKQEANTNWTTSSLAVFEKALSLAKEINDNEYASQQAVDSAVNGLNKAIENAELKGNAQKLQDVVDDALENEEALYTTASWNKLVIAVEDAKEKLTDTDDLSEAEVEKGISKIKQAIEALKYEVVSKENAIIAVEDAEAFIVSLEDPDKVYTQKSYEAFIKALDEVKALIDKDSGETVTLRKVSETAVTPIEFKEATAALQAAKDALIDVTALYTLMDEFTEIYEANEASYTEESFAAYQAAIDLAKEVVVDGTKEDVTETIDKITLAREALEVVADRDTLEQLVESYSKLEADDYTEASIAALTEKLAEAKDLLKEDASEEEITAMIEALESVVKELVSIKALQDKLQQAANVEESKYTAESYDALITAIQAIEDSEVVKDGSQKDIEQAVEKISAAIDNLVLRANAESVQALLDEMTSVNVDEYTKATAKAFAALLDELETLQANPNATANQFAALKADILDAKDSLVSIKELQVALEKAKAVNADDYLPSSYETLVAAMEQGASLLEDGTEDAIAEATEGLEQAIAALIAVADFDVAADAVEKAEKSLNQKDYDAAKVLVDALPAAPEKDSLLEKLTIIAEKIKAAEEEDEENPGQGGNGTNDGSGSDDEDKETSKPDNNGDGESDDTGKTESGEGEKLPSTATNNGNFLLIGLVLVSLSFLLFFVRRFKKVKS